MNVLTPAQKSVIETLAYFDLTFFPLTQTELYKYLYAKNQKIAYEELEDIANQLPRQIQKKQGMFFLKGRFWIDLRQQRFLIAERKYKKALRISKLLTYCVPGILSICVCNSLGYSNAKEESDIDFLIICKENTIYQTRLLCVFLLMLLGQRPTKKKRKDKICLSFFLSESEMNISSLKEREEDIYLLYWIALLFPIYNKQETYERFMKANEWVYTYLPNLKPVIASSRRSIASREDSLCAKALGCLPETWAKQLQEHKLPAYLKEKRNQSTHVIMNDNIIKLHANDRREYYFLQWKKRIKSLLKV